MLASSFGDPVLGLDVHIELVPTPAPVPTPIPNPFTGVIFDPMGLAVGLVISNAIGAVMGAPLAGPVVYWGAIPATNTGTEAKHVPGHILIPPGTSWAPFPKTPKPVIKAGETPKPPNPVKPEDDAVCVFGSKTVTVMGSNAVRLGDILLSCSEPVRLPSSVVMAVPKGSPILIGGPPSLDLMAAAFASLRTRFMSDSLHALISRMKPSRFRNFLHRAACFLTGHPVDVATGKVLTEAVDIDLPGPLPLKIERVYTSSFAERDSPLGHGWAHTLHQAVWEERGKVVYLAGDGREIEFDCFESPGHQMRPGDELWHPIDRLLLRRETADAWVIRTDDDRELHFGPILGAPAGRAMLTRISSIRGPRDVVLTYNAFGQLECVLDSAKRQLRFDYDENGRLSALLIPRPDPQSQSDEWYAHRTYTYSMDGDLVQVTDALGHSYHYEYTTHLLVRETNRAGTSFYFAYDGFGEDAWCIRTWGDEGIIDHAIAYDKQQRVTRVTDSLGHTKTYHMNLAGAVVKVVDPHGAATTVEYDDGFRITKVTDALGRATTMEWSARGKCRNVTRPDGSSLEITHDEEGRAVKLIDPVGGCWQRRYDAQGRVLERIDPLGRSLRMRYSAMGLVREIEHHNGTQTLLEHDDAGNVIAVRDPDGVEHRFSYDRLGRLTHINSPIRQEAYARDLEGRLQVATGTDGTTVRFSRNGEGDVTEVRGPTGVMMSVTYTGFRRRGAVQRPSGTVQYRYDTEQKLVDVEKSSGEIHRFEYDACGRVSAVTRFDGRRWKYHRDVLGRVTKTVRPSGAVVERRYDAAGRVAEIRYPDGTTDKFAYRPDGALIEAVNETASVRYERDIVGQITREWQDDEWIDSRYDPLGKRVQIASSLGAHESIERDVMGQVRALVASDSVFSWRVDFQRDLSGAEITRELPGVIKAIWERGSRGQALKRTTTRGHQILDSVQYRWTEGDRLAGLTTASGASTTYIHDNDGRLAAAQFPNGEVQYRLFDRAGNVQQHPDDRLRALEARTRLSTDDEPVIEYDADGRCVARRTAGGATWSYRHNGAGRLSEVVCPDGSVVSFRYDALGRRVAKQDATRTTRWIWDGDVPLHELPSDGPATFWVLDPYSFAPLAAIRSRQRCGIVSDHLGTPAAAYDESGELVWRQELDLYGVPRQQPGDVTRMDMPWRWPGQYADAETGLHYNRHRYYDPSTGQYLTQDPLGLAGGGAPYGYVGDPTRFIDPLGLQECTPYYHGTTREEAEKIIANGIDLDAGRMNLDFNPVGEGAFYVTRDPEQAARWAAEVAARTGGEPVVVKFDVPDSELAALDNRVFDAPDDEWASFVRDSRSGAGGPQHHPHDTVTGPYVTNPKDAENAMSSKPLKGRGDQTAVCTDEAAKVFDNSAKDVIPVE